MGRYTVKYTARTVNPVHDVMAGRVTQTTHHQKCQTVIIIKHRRLTK